MMITVKWVDFPILHTKVTIFFVSCAFSERFLILPEVFETKSPIGVHCLPDGKM